LTGDEAHRKAQCENEHPGWLYDTGGAAGAENNGDGCLSIMVEKATGECFWQTVRHSASDK